VQLVAPTIPRGPWRGVVQVATTVVGNFATDYEDGKVVDDYTLLTGDRILIQHVGVGETPTIYIVNPTGRPTVDDKVASILGWGGLITKLEDPSNISLGQVVVEFGAENGGAVVTNTKAFPDLPSWHSVGRTETPPQVFIYGDTDQTVPTGVDTPLAFSKERYDAGDLHNAVSTVITGATDTAPIVISSANHGLQTGDSALVQDVVGTVNANGFWVVTRIDNVDVSLDGSSGVGTPYISGGSIQKDPSRIVVSRAGLYQVTAQVSWDTDTVGIRRIMISKNGTVIAQVTENSWVVGGTETNKQQVALQDQMSKDDYIELQVYHSSAGSLDVIAGVDLTWLALSLIGER